MWVANGLILPSVFTNSKHSDVGASPSSLLEVRHTLYFFTLNKLGLNLFVYRTDMAQSNQSD